MPAEMTEPCVYCHQAGDPPTGFRRTCPGCGRSYLARFPRDEQQQRESAQPGAEEIYYSPAGGPIFTDAEILSGGRPAEMSNEQHIEQSQVQVASGERPATSADIRQPPQGSLF